MIQINLLPDVKLEFIKTQRTKRTVIGFAALVSLAAILVAILLALQVYVNQSLHTKALQEDIDIGIANLQAIEDLDTVLTVNQQLQTLPELHSQKPAAVRVPGLLVKLVPKDVDLTKLTIEYDEQTFSLTGQAVNTKTVNIFADILKNAVYSIDEDVTTTRIFSGVQFQIGVQGEDGVNFEAVMSFDLQIFDNNLTNVVFSVPSIISTQSSIRESSLFDLPIEEEEAE